MIYTWCLRRRLGRAVRESHKLVLTFDDGPGNRLTPAILDTLRDHGCHATFFVLGRSIPGREDILRRVQAEGHEIGSHGYDHLHCWRALPWRTIKDIARGWDAIDEALGRRGGRYPFRPPYGKLNALTLLYLRIKNVPICYWTADSTDTWPKENRDGQFAANQIKQTGGGVLLAHDFDRNSAEVDTLVMECLKSAIQIAKHRGFSILTFSGLMDVKEG